MSNYASLEAEVVAPPSLLRGKSDYQLSVSFIK